MPCWLHAVPCWLHAVPGWLHAVPRWLHAVPCWLHAVPGWLHAVPRWLHAVPYWLHVVPRWLHAVPRWLHAVPRWLHAVPYQLHAVPCICMCPSTLAKLLKHSCFVLFCCSLTLQRPLHLYQQCSHPDASTGSMCITSGHTCTYWSHLLVSLECTLRSALNSSTTPLHT